MQQEIFFLVWWNRHLQHMIHMMKLSSKKNWQKKDKDPVLPMERTRTVFFSPHQTYLPLLMAPRKNHRSWREKYNTQLFMVRTRVSTVHRIGWWENFNRKALYFMVKTHGFPVDFPLNQSNGPWIQRSPTNFEALSSDFQRLELWPSVPLSRGFSSRKTELTTDFHQGTFWKLGGADLLNGFYKYIINIYIYCIYI